MSFRFECDYKTSPVSRNIFSLGISIRRSGPVTEEHICITCWQIYFKLYVKLAGVVKYPHKPGCDYVPLHNVDCM